MLKSPSSNPAVHRRITAAIGGGRNNSCIEVDDEVSVLFDEDGIKYSSGGSNVVIDVEGEEGDLTPRGCESEDPADPGSGILFPSKKSIWRCVIFVSKFFCAACISFFNLCFRKSPHNISRRMDVFRSGGSYAVVTLISRQAAVAARQCRLNGSGRVNWINEKSLPVPPLADAAPWDVKTCRNCCRPVTLTLPVWQKRLRKYIVFFSLFVIYLGYTIPIAFIGELTKFDDDSVFAFAPVLNSLIPGLLHTVFFSAAPHLFLFLANFGSGALSLPDAVHTASNYYWYFQVTTSFTGSFLAGILSSFFFFFGQTGDMYGGTLRETLNLIAVNLPTVSSAIWLSWILLRTFLTLPLMRLCQFPALFFRALRWNCCARCVQGGGHGGPLPYRDYVDSSVVVICSLTFCIISPLVTVASAIYFLIAIPCYRRQALFVNRPSFIDGASRFTFLSNCVMGSLYTAVVFSGVTFFFKNMFIQSLLCFLTIFPLVDFQKSIFKSFGVPFKDVGLMQAGLIRDTPTTATAGMAGMAGTSNYHSTRKSKQEEDDNNDETEEEGIRERYRSWLIDAHKAAFVPICLLGSKEAVGVLTSTPM